MKGTQPDFTSYSKRRGQQPEWQRNRQKYNLQYPMNRDADDAEREQDQPHERIGDQRQQSQRPADDKQNAPEEESEHGRPPCFLIHDTAEAYEKFPGLRAS